MRHIAISVYLILILSLFERIILVDNVFIMAAICNRAGYYIFALWFLSLFFLLLYGSPYGIGQTIIFILWFLSIFYLFSLA